MALAFAHELSQPLTAIIAYAGGSLRLLAEPVTERALVRLQATSFYRLRKFVVLGTFYCVAGGELAAR